MKKLRKLNKIKLKNNIYPENKIKIIECGEYKFGM